MKREKNMVQSAGESISRAPLFTFMLDFCLRQLENEKTELSNLKLKLSKKKRTLAGLPPQANVAYTIICGG